MSIQTALVAAVRLILDDDEYDVGWGRRSAEWRAESHTVISYVSTARRGVDERRYADVGTDDMRERVYGNRVVRVQFTVHTDDQDVAESAHEIAGRLVAGFSRSDVAELLDSEDLGGIRPQDPIDASYVDEHGDERSVAVFEVWFNTHRTHTGTVIPRVKALEYSGTTEGSINDPTVGPTTVE